jgi:hypothetical protein
MVRVRLALLAVLLSAWLPPGASAATIILVRHADRNSGMSADALLSPAGEERARQSPGGFICSQSSSLRKI